MATAAVQKSTTDRLPPVRFPGWLRGGFQATSWLSKQAAADLARRLFFTPPRAPTSEIERSALDQASHFKLRTPRGVVQGYGWGRGPVALLAHGWGGHAGQMTHFVPGLVERGFRAVAFDMPAHGESQGQVSSLLHFGETLEAAAELLGQPKTLIAHSFGAAAATWALARGLGAERAVFVAPPAGFESFWKRFRQGLSISPEVWDLLVRDAERWLRVRFADVQPRVLAPQLAVPLLVMHDRNDRQVIFEEGAELAGLWRGAVLEPTRGLGHNRILREGATVGRAAEFAAG